jgi:hypothetical protein
LDPDVAQAIKLPVNFDLGRVEFSVVPQAENRIRLVDDPAMATQISRCITITTPLHWPDETVTTFIEMHHSPVDVAFDVFLDVGGREWKLGQISAPQGGDSDLSHSSFSVRDGMHVPASGLHFRFRSNPSLALRSVALRACWQGELTLEPQPDRR